MLRDLLLLAAFMVFSVIPFHVHATTSDPIIFDNGGPGLQNVGASDFDFPLQQADDFVLSTGSNTITDVHFWGIYAASNTATEPDDFTIRIFADDSGKPTLDWLHEFNVGDIGRADTGQDLNTGQDVYEYWTVIPATTIDAGVTHWLSVVNNTDADTDDNWFWVQSISPGNRKTRNGDGVAWGDPSGLDFELAFHLTGVPEPSTLLLSAFGMLGLCKRRRMRG